MATMMLDPSKTSMGVGFQSNRGRMGDPQAWKKAIGSHPVSARLALLPDPERRWDRMGVSAFGQIAFLGFLLLIPMAFPEQMKTALNLRPTELMQPVTLIPVAPPPPPPPPPPKIKPKPVQPKPEVPEPVKLNPKQPHVFLTAKAIQPEMKKVEVKPLELNPKFDEKVEVETKQPKRPKDEVKIGNLSSGSAAPATVVAPLNKVQTGGFGDPNGIPGKGDPNHGTNVNRLGSPALPGGEGYGNGTGGKNGIAGTVASTGFGNGVATPPTGGKKTGSIAGGFGAVDTSSDPSKKKAAASGPADTTPNILDKPRPEYTAEGRSMRIEGDVVIDLVFLANGSIQINRVVNGLGHGLDESALRAAQQIKFKPAKREGEPVDFPARVRIEFRLAY